MSRSYSPVLNFRHLDDCKQSGCPRHTIRAIYNHTIDMVDFEIDGKTQYLFDPNEWIAMMQSFNAIEGSPEWINDELTKTSHDTLPVR